jgi:hypothetical protein
MAIAMALCVAAFSGAAKRFRVKRPEYRALM